MSHSIAAIQMTSGMDLKANLERAGQLLKEAADCGVKLAVLPEMFPLLGTGLEFIKAKQAIQEEAGRGPIQEFLSAQAKQHQMWIVGGSIAVRSLDPNKSYAASLVYDAKGKQVARYDKIHLFDATVSPTEIYQESASVVAGEKTVIIDTPCGKMGLSICYDLRFPEMYREMFARGAEIFAVPSAFTVPTGKAHWEILMRAAAVQNLAYVIGAAQWGVHGMGRQTYGDSLIVNPRGEVIARLEKGVGVMTAEIDLELLHAQRRMLMGKE